MSRTAAKHNMTITRGSTWEETFDYVDDAGAAIDLTGYEARMQVRLPAAAYGTAVAAPVLELTTLNGLLSLVIPPGKTLRNRISITVSPADHAALNPTNLKKAAYVYSIELYPSASPDYVLPLVEGKIGVKGEVTR